MRRDDAVRLTGPARRLSADLALAMQAEAARRTDPSGQPLQVRIGIDTGPVVAGVIGRDRFSYDRARWSPGSLSEERNDAA